jgi:arylsulfatase A-like enzyme
MPSAEDSNPQRSLPLRPNPSVPPSLATKLVFSVTAAALASAAFSPAIAARPNIVLIYADDLGYGDLGSYGATAIPTPRIDRLAEEGIRFTNSYATSATCTPSRYGLLTGEYPWRRKGTGILDGADPLIIPTDLPTLPKTLQAAGYATAVIGKWHLGLGASDQTADWNGKIAPGPAEVGFDTHFIMAATGDRVPTVFVRDGRVVGLDPDDPIAVSYGTKIGSEPTGRENPELLRVGADNQHSDTIVHGVSRIGFMTGGKSAVWRDEEMGDTFAAEVIDFIERQSPERPFFLFYAVHEPHVPRVPHPRFVGSTPLGPRGDAIAQFDANVGQVLDALERSGLAKNTLVILTSDNGPVLDDGYHDRAVELNGSHAPWGPLAGGKYSKLEAGTRVPLIIRWLGQVEPGATSEALVSQIDFFASLAALAGQALPPGAGPDSEDALPALLGRSASGRQSLVQQGMSGIAFRKGDWKYIPPRAGARQFKGMRSGNDPQSQLYRLTDDPAELHNLAAAHPEKLAELKAALEAVVGPSGE